MGPVLALPETGERWNNRDESFMVRKKERERKERKESAAADLQQASVNAGAGLPTGQEVALIFRCQGTYKQRQQRQEEDGGNFEKGHDWKERKEGKGRKGQGSGQGHPIASHGTFVVFVAVNQAFLNQGAQYTGRHVVILKGRDFVKPTAAWLIHSFLDRGEEGLLFIGEGHCCGIGGSAGDRSLAPLDEVWAPLPTRAPPPVPLAKPSHCAAPCAGLHGWHVGGHLQVGESMETETKRARENHTMGQKSTPVTILHNRPTTIETLGFRQIVTILHNGRPTMERPEIAEIVTILHNPGISGICALTHKSPMRLQTPYALMRLDA